MIRILTINLHLYGDVKSKLDGSAFRIKLIVIVSIDYILDVNRAMSAILVLFVKHLIYRST